LDAVALGPKRIREQQFVMEDLADPVTVELVTSTKHKVSLKKVIDWISHAGGASPKETPMKARVPGGTTELDPKTSRRSRYQPCTLAPSARLT
jgi:hypothetical protein